MIRRHLAKAFLLLPLVVCVVPKGVAGTIPPPMCPSTGCPDDDKITLAALIPPPMCPSTGCPDDDKLKLAALIPPPMCPSTGCPDDDKISLALFPANSFGSGLLTATTLG